MNDLPNLMSFEAGRICSYQSLTSHKTKASNPNAEPTGRNHRSLVLLKGCQLVPIRREFAYLVYL